MSKHNNKKSASRRAKKTHFLQNLSYSGDQSIPTSIELLQYDEQQASSKIIHSEQDMRNEISDRKVSWFKVVGFSDLSKIENICRSFGIHRFDIKDMLSEQRVTKVVTYDKATFIIVSGCHYDQDGQIDVQQVAFILGNNYVISFQESPSSIFDEIADAIRHARAHLREKKADYLLYVMLNGIHSLYIDNLYKIEEKMEEVEDQIIDHQLTDKLIMQFFRTKRKEFVLIRRLIVPFREELNNLIVNSNKIIQDSSIVYFNDFDDRLRTTLDELEIMSESIDSLMGLYFNNNDLKMNEIMKRLTIISTIFIPLTFMVGVWGMNFKYMPELEWEHGYYVAWGSMLVVAIIAILFLKKKRWM